MKAHECRTAGQIQFEGFTLGPQNLETQIFNNYTNNWKDTKKLAHGSVRLLIKVKIFFFYVDVYIILWGSVFLRNITFYFLYDKK